MKGMIQYKGHPRQVAEVLQKGKNGEENRHGREHDAHHPGQHPVDPQHQRPVEPFRRVQVSKEAGQPVKRKEASIWEGWLAPTMVSQNTAVRRTSIMGIPVAREVRSRSSPLSRRA